MTKKKGLFNFSSSDEVKTEERKLIQTYVVPLKLFSFSVKVLDEAGNLVPLRDPHSRAQRLLDDGTPLFIEKTYTFTNVIDSLSKGTMSIFNVYSDTPANVRKRIEELHADRKSSVMTREEWIKERNPEQWEEIQRRKTLENEVGQKYLSTIESQAAEIAEMKAKLAKLDKGE